MIHLLLLVLGTVAWTAATAIVMGTAAPAWERAATGGVLTWACAGGLIAGVVLPALGRWLSPSAAEFLMALDHESAHAIAAVFTGGRVETMSVSSRGTGKVRHAGSKATWFVALAPYVIPTTTIVALFVALCIPGPMPPVHVGIVTATLGYHLASDWMEAGPHQPDIADHGGWLALFAVAGAWAVTLGLVLAGVLLGPRALAHDALAGARALWDAALSLR